MTADPALSVIVPVHNRERMIGDAIRSLLMQGFADFELIVVDDGSTDGSAASVRTCDDRRVRLLRHERNRGISAARNTGLAAARGRYIAWLDSDDVARPGRLAAQIAFLENNPGIALCGSAGGKIDGSGRPRRGLRVPPLSPDACRGWLLFRPCAQQSSIAGRAEVLRAFSFDEERAVCEDYDVLARIASAGHDMCNLPRRLFDRRIHGDQIIRQRRDAIRDHNMAVSGPLLGRLGVDFRDDDLAFHFELGNIRYWGVEADAAFLERAADWLAGIAAANRRVGYCDPASAAFALGFFWLSACNAARRRLGTAKALRRCLADPVARAIFGRDGRQWLAARVGEILAGGRSGS